MWKKQQLLKEVEATISKQLRRTPNVILIYENKVLQNLDCLYWDIDKYNLPTAPSYTWDLWQLGSLYDVSISGKPTKKSKMVQMDSRCFW